MVTVDERLLSTFLPEEQRGDKLRKGQVAISTQLMSNLIEASGFSLFHGTG